jgi:hypothetical protein
VALLFVSPSVLLALYGAHTDSAICILVFVSLTWAARPASPGRGSVAAVVVLLGGMLKFYPAIALAGGAVFSRGARRILFATALTGFALHGVARLPEPALVSQKTLRDYHASYGSNVLATGFRNHFFEKTWPAEALRRFDRVAPALGLGFYFALIFVDSRSSWRNHAVFAPVECDDRTRA